MLFDGPISAPQWDGRFGGITYSGYRPGQGPAQHRYPSDDEVRRDLALLSGLTGRIRTYTSTEGPDVPALAAEFGLKVMAGAWLDGTAKDDSELRGLWRQARTRPNIDRLIVGNETLLREDLSVAELIGRLDETRKRTRLPVSTAEPWGIWLAHPELARHADFIAIHLLPYWEWKSVNLAVNHAIRMYLKVRQAYPNKPIVITETGWPSHGEAHGEALATIRNQSLYLRNFTKWANDIGLDYYVVEGFDQQWKRDEEGRPGPHWGIMDAERRMKFQGSGVLWGESGRPSWSAWSSVAGLIVSLLFCLVLHRLSLRAKIAFSLLSFALAYLVAWYANAHAYFYAESWSSPLRAMLVVMTALGMLVLLVQVIEACEVLGNRRWLRAFGPRPLAADAEQPSVSIHLACANEPPAMVIRALESLNRVNWKNLEVIVVDNNTADPRLWRPVEAWVARHADRFRFFHLPECPGLQGGGVEPCACANRPAGLGHRRGRCRLPGVAELDSRSGRTLRRPVSRRRAGAAGASRIRA